MRLREIVSGSIRQVQRKTPVVAVRFAAACLLAAASVCWAGGCSGNQPVERKPDAKTDLDVEDQAQKDLNMEEEK